MNVLKCHMKQKELNCQDLSHITGMNYHKVCRLMRQDQNHIETQLEASFEIIRLFDVLGLKELAHEIECGLRQNKVIKNEMELMK